jgi:hypothetical protein
MKELLAIQPTGKWKPLIYFYSEISRFFLFLFSGYSPLVCFSLKTNNKKEKKIARGLF